MPTANDPQEHSKMNQFYVKKTSKSRPGGTNIEVQRASGARLDGSWAVCGHPGRFWKRLGQSWKLLEGALEATWAILGRKGWLTWLQVSPPNGAKIDEKSIPKLIYFLMSLGSDLWKDFGGFRLPKWNQVMPKLGSQIDVNLEMRFFKKLYFS